MDENKSVVISKKTINRLVSDVSELLKNPLTKDNIYYQHDDENILKGYAMIVGPSDTPYYGGYYFFLFNFPTNYPHSPPKVTYYTNDGLTRFNPNLYKNGKVCLSVLNTWRGEGWTGCQTISSILLTLCTVLNNKPLLNEPGILENHADFNNYNHIITIRNYEIALVKMLNKEFLNPMFYIFYDQMIEIFILNYESYIDNINLIKKNIKKEFKNQIYIGCGMYGMSAKLDYKDTLTNIKALYKALNNKNNVSNEVKLN